MIAKELIDARWKFVVGGLVAVAAAIFSAYSFELVQQVMAGMDMTQVPESMRGEFELMVGGYDTYTWSQWFRSTGVQIAAVLAAFLGGSLIAGEVGKGTIFFLLSKPVTRERVLLTKYAVAALVLLGVLLLATAALLITSAVMGHPQHVGGALLSTLLLWLGMMFVLGLALLFSVVFDDVLRPIGLAVLVAALLGLPALFPGGRDLNLTAYWTSLPAYMGTDFPAKEIAVTLVAAAVPVAAALLLFKKRAF